MPGPSITQSQVQVSLRALLVAILPANWEVVQGQDSRVSEPAGNFVIMTSISRTRLETNGYSYAPPPAGQMIPGTLTTTQPMQVTFQLDFHSANPFDASDAAVVVSTLFRSDIAVDALAQLGTPISPLYADDPKQIPFLNAEQQYETRWVLDAVLQVNAGVVYGQDFMSGAPAIGINPPAG